MPNETMSRRDFLTIIQGQGYLYLYSVSTGPQLKYCTLFLRRLGTLPVYSLSVSGGVWGVAKRSDSKGLGPLTGTSEVRRTIRYTSYGKSHFRFVFVFEEEWVIDFGIVDPVYGMLNNGKLSEKQ